MQSYDIAEGSFELPGTWIDETSNVLRTPAPDGSWFTLLINRLDPEKRPFPEFADFFFTEQRRVLSGFQLLGRRTVAVGGAQAEEAVFTWIHPDGQMHHHVFLFPSGDRVLSVLASSRAKFAEGCEELVTRWMATVRWKGV